MSTGRRYTAREMRLMAQLLKKTSYTGAALQLLQAAETEAQVIGLVKAMENYIKAGGDLVYRPRVGNKATDELYALTKALHEALSKFRGEA
jgi:hypothetical protein